jgi:hypothetical protein
MEWPPDPFDDDAPPVRDDPQGEAPRWSDQADSFDAAVGDAWESRFELGWSDTD